MDEVGGLRVVDVKKSFGGVKALRGVSIEFKRGFVHALLGANGAGKSTLISICTGALAPDHGQVEMDTIPIHLPNPRHAKQNGIAVVHQEPAVMPSLTVAQNLAIEEVGAMAILSRLSPARVRAIARGKLARLGIDLPLDTRLGDLPVSMRQLVEIARALSGDPRVLFLDEPNSSLSHEETDRLLRVCRAMADGGCAVVFVTHRLREVFSIADEATVLRDGLVVWTGKGSSVTIPEAVSMMAGGGTHEAREFTTKSDVVKPAGIVVRVEGLARKNQFVDVNLEVAAGEVLGISGLIGSGRTELVSAIAGLTRPSDGRIMFGGRHRRSWKDPGQAWRAGVSMVPEDRQHDGLFSGMSVEWNMMSVCRSLGIAPISTAAQMVDRLGIKTPSLSVPVSSLSGGNQQKVILARAMLTGPRLLILDEPTRGVDVSAKADIYALIREQASEGCAVILVSSELDEVIELSDRVIVMRQGGIVKEFGAHPTSSQLIATAFGEEA